MYKIILSLVFMGFLFNSNLKADEKTDATAEEYNQFDNPYDINSYPTSPHNPTSPHVYCSSNECYTEVRHLGSGAFGSVYEVEDSKGQHFALKNYHALRFEEDYKETDFFEDASREFLRGQLLNHPNIVKTYDLFTTVDDGYFSKHLVLELVKGKPLYEITRGALNENEVMQASLHFCQALAYALAQGYVFIDLHDGNLMLNDDLDIMLIDLASFFTVDEVFNYAQTVDEESTFDNRTYKTLFWLGVDGPNHEKKDQAQKLALGPIREAKLKSFFNANPKLLAEMKRHPQSAKNKLKPQKMGMGNNPFSATSPERVQFLLYYFTRISDMCISLISKSNMSREVKIHALAEIQKLSWNYSEDVHEGKTFEIDDSLNTLTQVITEYKES